MHSGFLLNLNFPIAYVNTVGSGYELDIYTLIAGKIALGEVS